MHNKKRALNTYTSGPCSVGAEALPPAQLQRDEWMMLPLGPSDKALSIMTKREKEEADKETKAEEVS